MAKKEIISKIDGYDDIINQSITLEKYGFDYETKKGEIKKIVDGLHPKALNLKVSKISKETSSTSSIRLVSEDGYLPPFQAGQYINVFVDALGVKTSRPYSIASAPTQTGYYEIAVRRVEDGFVSNYLLDDLKPADKLVSSSPAGNFHFNPLIHGDKLAFIAGGSGITPFMSMIRELSDRALKRRIHLFYGSRVADDIIYAEELNEIAASNSNFTWDLVVSEPSESFKGINGFITSKIIKDRLTELDWAFFVCGPQAMYDFCLPELERLNIPRRWVRQEVMGAPKNIASHPGWPEDIGSDAAFKVSVKGKRTIDAKACEPLMISFERAGIVIPALCRSGECSLCRTKLISGKVYQPNGVKLRKSDRAFGYIHPCMAYPVSDIEVMI
jgi:ferredoxin-NADP reductase